MLGREQRLIYLIIKFDDVKRGDTLATAGSLVKTYMLDSEIKLINDDRANLELWDRVRILCRYC